MLLAGCGQSPQRLATRYLADLQQFNYPACYATLTDEDRAARPLKEFLTEIPMAPDVDPIWFRAVLFSTSYKVGQPKVDGERAVVPVKVTMPDLTLWSGQLMPRPGRRIRSMPLPTSRSRPGRIPRSDSKTRW